MRTPTQEQAGVLIAMIAVMFGAWVRLIIPWMAGFPVNDGGLFYVMLKALAANGMRIPELVQYNGLSIPFAYPPLGFYAGALVGKLLGWDEITVLRWLPAIVLVGTLPAFYWLAKEVLGTSWKAGIATLLFAFTPRAITWQVMGGGLTRAFGQVFLLLALAAIYQMFTRGSRRDWLLATVFSGLVVLSHPEAALQAAGLAVLVWAVRGTNRQGVLNALKVGVGTLVFTAPWWLRALTHYGSETLLSAAKTGLHSWLYLIEPFLMNFIDEPLMTLIAVFGVIGVAYELARRRGLLTLWFVAPFVIEPRSAPTVSMISLAMLAAVGLTEVILPALAGASGTVQEAASNPVRSRAVNLFLLFIALYMLGNASLFGSQMAATVLTPQSREAFDWIKANTPPGSRFLVLTGSEELFCDSTQEWFPALTGRTSVTTIQGKEWQQGGDFMSLRTSAQALQNCVLDVDPLGCVRRTAPAGVGASYDYLWLNGEQPIYEACRSVGHAAEGARLMGQLKGSADYTLLYENEGAAVFRVP